MTKKRFGTMAACLALVGAVAVGGTLALLASDSKQLTNTFTVGTDYQDNDFLLKEHKVDQVVTATQATEGYEQGDYKMNADTWEGTTSGITANQYTQIVPDSKLDKDPWFEISETAPNSWIVAKVTGVDALEAKGITVASFSNEWAVVSEDEENGGYKFETLTTSNFVDGATLVYTKQLADDDNDTSSIFSRLNVAASFDEENFGSATDNQITIKGVAIQALAGDEINLDANSLKEIMASLPEGF